MRNLCKLTGLSTYCLDLLYDFNPHRFSGSQTIIVDDSVTETNTAGRPINQILLDVICHNTAIFCFHKDLMVADDNEETGSCKKKHGKGALRKALVQQREQELDRRCKAGEMTVTEKDYLMVHEFCATAYTSGGHFIYVYYVGPPQRSPQDLASVSHWAPVDKNHLPLFHRRLSKNVQAQYQFASSDVTETADGRHNLDIDMRFIVNKWIASQHGEKCLPLLRDNAQLFVRGEDYLVKRHLQQQQPPPTPQKTPKRVTKPAPLPSGLDFESGFDPYEVREQDFCHISDADWDRIQDTPLPEEMRCDFIHFLDISRRAVLREEIPPQEYERDPIHLVDALCIANNLELHCKSTAALVTRQHTQTVINDNMTRLIDTLSLEPGPVGDIKSRLSEYWCACMAVEHASRTVPSHLQEKLKQQ